MNQAVIVSTAKKHPQAENEGLAQFTVTTHVTVKPERNRPVISSAGENPPEDCRR
jgi:hypothetical protein